MAHGECNCYFSFWAIFCTFSPIAAQKMIISKKKIKKMPGDIILQKCTKNHDQMVYCSWDMARDTCNCYFSFSAIFFPFYPLAAQKLKFQKHENGDIIILEISSFYTCVRKVMIRWCKAPEIWCATDGRTDRWKKWDTEVGVPPKNCDDLNNSNSLLSISFSLNFIGSSKQLYYVLTYLIN